MIAIALGLGASAIICLLLTDDDPLAIYSTIIKGTFGTPRKTWVTFRDVAMLLCSNRARSVLSPHEKHHSGLPAPLQPVKYREAGHPIPALCIAAKV